MVSQGASRAIARVLAAAAAGSLAACAAGPEGGPSPSAEPQLQQCREAWQAKDYDRAVERAEEALEIASDPREIQEALYLAGLAERARDRPRRAFRHLQVLLHDYPASPLVEKIEAPLYEIGSALIDEEPWPLFGDLFSGRELGAEVLREYAVSFPQSPRADDARAAIAELRYQRGDWDLARLHYKEIVEKHPRSEWCDLAAFRLGMTHLLQSRGASYDRTPLFQAQRAFDDYLVRRPDGALRAQAEDARRRAREMLGEGELEIAELYALRGEDKGARLHYANTVLAFGDTAAGERARRRLEEKGWDLSYNSLDGLLLEAPAAAPAR